MAAITFKPKTIVKRFLAVLPERGSDILKKRFGLGDTAERMTLEEIGQKYGITRERVRQIENAAISLIKRSDVFKKEQAAFKELEELILSEGGVVGEDEFLASASKDKSTQNHLHLMLVLGDIFEHHKEDEQFKRRWVVDHKTAEKVHESLRKLYEGLSDDELIPEGDLVATFLDHLKDISERYKNEEIIRRWLSLSKGINKNPLGEWGVATSSNVRARGIRDYAFLVIRQHGSPMHFTEVAKAITKIFGKKAHVATCHNELIKDKRFVLVGRGLYALSEWGYEKGVVKNVIKRILEREGPLAKDDIVDKVLKERYVKENTILVNLQDSRYFKKDSQGRYAAVA